MSYSRWSNSKWYTYWCVGPERTIEDRDNAIFSICSIMDFSAKQIRNDINDCLALVANYANSEYSELKSADIDELGEYMVRFLDDVDSMYKTNSQEVAK